MNMKALEQVWGEIENWGRCGDCPLKGNTYKHLLFKPCHPVSVMVVTEGPNRVENKEFIASLANHPTFTYLTALAGGEFTPEGEGANVYWTHVRKCFVQDETGQPLTDDVKGALESCWATKYLDDEIAAVRPKLIVAVGGKAKDFLGKYNSKLYGTLEGVLKIQAKSNQPMEVNINGFSTMAAVVPHPSGRSFFWKRPPPETKKVLEMVRGEFLKIIAGMSSR